MADERVMTLSEQIKMQATNRRLRDALYFYANGDNWDDGTVKDDEGTRALAALSSTKPKGYRPMGESPVSDLDQMLNGVDAWIETRGELQCEIDRLKVALREIGHDCMVSTSEAEVLDEIASVVDAALASTEPEVPCHHGPRCDGRGVNCGPAGAVVVEPSEEESDGT